MNKRIKLLNIGVAVLLLGAVLATGLLAGCKSLEPGADPLVVRVEQTQSAAKGAFDLVLNFDHANRPFWQTNAPAFHQFCETLRTPTLTADGLMLPKCSAMLWSLDKVKLAYKAGAAGSNDVATILFTVNESLTQANAWLTITKGK